MKQPLKLTTRQGERIAVVAGLRTPFAKQATAFHGVPAVDLGKLVVSEMLARTDLDPKLIDQLVFGQVVQMPEAPNIAREIVLGTGMSVSTDAYSVSRACATISTTGRSAIPWKPLCPSRGSWQCRQADTAVGSREKTPAFAPATRGRPTNRPRPVASSCCPW